MNEDLKHTFGIINDWLKFAEAKNIALTTIIGAIIFGIIQSWAIIPSWMHCEIKYFVLPVFSACFMICIWSFIPKLDYNKILQRTHNQASSSNKRPKDDSQSPLSSQSEGTTKSQELPSSIVGKNLIYFGDLRHFDIDNLISAYSINSATVIEKDVAGQIIVNSKIAWKKYQLFKIAGNMLFWGFLLGVVFIFLDQILDFNFTAFVLWLLKLL